MAHIPVYPSALLLYCFCLTPVKLVSTPVLVVVHPGYNITLQCTNILKAPGHVAWFKQVNESEPLCIVSMYSTETLTRHYNSFHPSHMEMFIRNTTIFLKITEVDVADSGRYFCGLFNKYFIFTNATNLNVQGHGDSDNLKTLVQCQKGQDNDGTVDLFLLVVILGGVTAVLMIVIIILVFKIREDTTRLNTGPDSQPPPQHVQEQDPESLNYASLNFISKKRKMDRKREKLLEPHVVYASTR